MRLNIAAVIILSFRYGAGAQHGEVLFRNYTPERGDHIPFGELSIMINGDSDNPSSRSCSVNYLTYPSDRGQLSPRSVMLKPEAGDLS